MTDHTIKRKSKDSVFVKLFHDKENILKLYKELHPEDTDVSIDDINITTLESFILNTQYNDLGFTVKDKLVFLAEAQSTWNLNILVRMLIYIVETYRKYLDATSQSVHQSSKVKLPLPELYVFYSGKTERPKVISLNEEFFDGKADIDLKIRIFNQVDTTIAGQYIGYCRVFDDECKNYTDPVEAAKAIFRICIEKGYLTDFMRSHEQEVVDMMSELFDVEYMTRQYEKAMKREREEEKRKREEKYAQEKIKREEEYAQEKIKREEEYAQEKIKREEEFAKEKIKREEEFAKEMAKAKKDSENKGRADMLKEAINKMIASGMSEEQAKGILGL